jgi:hypothetical protein
MLMEAVTEKLAQSDRPNGTDKADHMLISVSGVYSAAKASDDEGTHIGEGADDAPGMQPL